MGDIARRLMVPALAALLVSACGSAAAVPRPSLSPLSSPSPVLSPSPTPSASAPSPSPEPKRWIRISLLQQHLWAYEGRTIVVSTDVTTGMPDLPTPLGAFSIKAKYSPYEFISPWPPGSPYFYEPLWVDYAMLFADGGYFIHDAWWQRNFGPGGNLKTGSHGCVNVPPAAMPALYAWARVGDEVVVGP